MHISVLISTFGDRVRNLPRVFRTSESGVTYYVCHQGVEDNETPDFSFEREDVVYFRTDTTGVTKSRNLLVEKALEVSTDIIYFCDDDITLVPDFAEKIRDGFRTYDAGVLTFEVNNERGQPRKVYPAAGTARSRGNILSVGTVEVAVRSVAMGSRRFPEDLGAGTLLPVGDEAVFLAQFLESGVRVSHVNAVLCCHPDESSGASTGLEFNKARGVTVRRVFGFTKGFIILIYFMLLRRNLIFCSEKFSHYSAVCSLYKGFFRA